MREDRHGVTGTLHEEVFFTEARLPDAKVLGPVKIEISRQNANLTMVKERMAAQARAFGATTIQGFRYGQRAHNWWQKAFSFKWDTESWYGEGEACLPR